MPDADSTLLSPGAPDRLALSSLTPIVYTMGKVASTSVSLALLEAGLPCHDIHTLNPDSLRNASNDALAQGRFPLQHVCVSMAYREQLIVKRNKCLYISLVRDPIARNLSAFFQNLGLHSGNTPSLSEAKDLFQKFQDTYPHLLPLTYFDREYRTQLDINVYSMPFDHAAGYAYLPRYNTVIFRVDCPDETKSRVLSELLDTPIKVGRMNDGADKDYNDIYNAVKKLATFPDAFLDQMYSSKFAQHFWTQNELQKMRQKWVPKKWRLF